MQLHEICRKTQVDFIGSNSIIYVLVIGMGTWFVLFCSCFDMEQFSANFMQLWFSISFLIKMDFRFRLYFFTNPTFKNPLQNHSSYSLVEAVFFKEKPLLKNSIYSLLFLQQTFLFLYYYYMYLPFIIYAFYYICLLPCMPFPTYAFSHPPQKNLALRTPRARSAQKRVPPTT